MCTSPSTVPWLLRPQSQNRVLHALSIYTNFTALPWKQILSVPLWLLSGCHRSAEWQVNEYRHGEEGGEHGCSVMKSNNSLRLMGECCCARSTLNSIGFSGARAHIPGILSLAPQRETPKSMWVMRAGSGPGFSVSPIYCSMNTFTPCLRRNVYIKVVRWEINRGQWKTKINNKSP